MVLLGLVRGIGGFVLLTHGSAADPGIRATETATWIVGVMLLLVSLSLIVAGVGVSLRRRALWVVGLACTVAFVIDGAINGWALYGRPGAGGTIANAIVALIILACLLAGRPALPTRR